jgi:hypothetical protein
MYYGHSFGRQFGSQCDLRGEQASRLRIRRSNGQFLNAGAGLGETSGANASRRLSRPRHRAVEEPAQARREPRTVVRVAESAVSAVGRAKVTNESRSLFLLVRDQVRVATSLRGLREPAQIVARDCQWVIPAGVPVLEVVLQRDERLRRFL